MKFDINRNNTMPTFTSALKAPKQKNENETDETRLAAKPGEDEQELIRKQQEQQKKMQRENELDMLNEQLESSKEQAENSAKEFSALGKCLTIANRIMRGDIVPEKDMKFLMEHELDLFKQAILMRQPNNDPKRHDSVLDEDDEPDGASEALPPEGESGSEISTESLTEALGE